MGSEISISLISYLTFQNMTNLQRELYWPSSPTLNADVTIVRPITKSISLSFPCLSLPLRHSYCLHNDCSSFLLQNAAFQSPPTMGPIRKWPTNQGYKFYSRAPAKNWAKLGKSGPKQSAILGVLIQTLNHEIDLNYIYQQQEHVEGMKNHTLIDVNGHRSRCNWHRKAKPSFSLPNLSLAS